MNNFFFNDLKACSNLGLLCEGVESQQLPDGWSIFIVDVENSTEAIAQGEYKSVNSIGVAAITAVLNVVKEIAIPYAFGGDGATFCIPGELVESVSSVLMSTKEMAQKSFGFSLRVGKISIAEIRSAGFDVVIGKFRVSEHCVQACFSGGGVTYAEERIKKNSSQYEVKVKGPLKPADFNGFECRWKNIPSSHGETVSYLIKVTKRVEGNYQAIIDVIETLFGDAQQRHPLNAQQMRLSFHWKHLKNEHRIKTYQKNEAQAGYGVKMVFQNLLGRICMFYRIQHAAIDWGLYKNRAIDNTDVCKFDDMLRLVVAGTSEQRKRMQQFLEEEFIKGNLIYGQHVSDAAMMTCYVKDYIHQHYHFVDGADGGYALASIDFKKRMAKIKRT